MLGTRTVGLPDCRPLLADPEDLTLVFQPIVDLAAATVAGYEPLARFPGVAGPDAWFAAAAEAGIAAELEALAIHKALAAVPSLPPNTFLTVNVSPHLLGSAPVQHALATRPDLHRVVVELTEHTPVHDLAALRRQTDELRRRGALIALDDAGSGYSGLQQLAALRPQIVKLDRALGSDRDTDPVRVALAEARGARGEARRVRRPDRRLDARRRPGDPGGAGRVHAARRPPGPGLGARPARPGLPPAVPRGDPAGARPVRPGAAHRPRGQPAPAGVPGGVGGSRAGGSGHGPAPGARGRPRRAAGPPAR